MSKVKSFFKDCFVLVLIVALAYVGLMVWENRDNLPFISKDQPEPTAISTDWIQAEMVSIAQYATLSYQYTNVSQFENIKQFYGWRLPLTSKSFIVKYDGEMKLGINGEDIATQIAGDTINIQLPSPIIISHVIKEDSIEVFDQSHNIFNQIEIEDYAQFATDQKSVMESRAFSEGVYQNAQQAAEDQIGGFVRNLPGIKGKYQIIISSASIKMPEKIEATPEGAS